MRVAVIHNRDRAGVINVFGPQNRERYNPETVERVAASLEKGGHTVRIIDGNMHLIEQLRDFLPEVREGERPGMVFNMAYGIQGVSRYTHLPAILEMLGVHYVGSNPMAHGLALDKVIAKIVFQSSGLPTPGYWNFASADDRFEDLVFPVIVKPKMEAVSYGIRVVDNERDLRDAVKLIIDEFQQHVLVEQFIPGREFAVGLLGNGAPEVLPIVEIDLEGDPEAIQTADNKLTTPRSKICPAELADEKAGEMRELVQHAFRSLDLFDFARVDLRMDADGNLYTSVTLGGWDVSDWRGRTRINFDGWKFIGNPFPADYASGHYGLETHRWSRSAEMKAPVKVTRLYVIMREKLVYVTDMVPAISRSIELRDLTSSGGLATAALRR